MTRRQRPAKTVGEYIETFPQDVRAKLKTIRKVVRESAPDAEEVISYRIPAFKVRGRALVYFAAYQHHIGMYPFSSGMATQREVSPYKTSKGTIQFPLDKPLPLPLIRKIVKHRMQRI